VSKEGCKIYIKKQNDNKKKHKKALTDQPSQPSLTSVTVLMWVRIFICECIIFFYKLVTHETANYLRQLQKKHIKREGPSLKTRD